jgi:hypothetical protein
VILTIQDTILRIVEFTHTLGGLYFLICIVSIVYSIYVVHSLFVKRDFKGKTKSAKALSVAAIVISIFCLIEITLAGDVTHDMSPEETGRAFGGMLSQGADLHDYRDKVFTPGYQTNFFDEWENNLEELVGCNPDFDLIEYHYKSGNVRHLEEFQVVLRTSKLLHESEKIEASRFSDYWFHIHLNRIPISSRFLGNYMRWRISAFSYTTSEPYTLKTLKKQVESVKKEIQSLMDAQKE